MPQNQPNQGGQFLPLLMGLIQLKQRDKELEAQKHAQRTAGLTALIDAAKNSADPTQLTALAQLGEQNDLGSASQLMKVFANIQPSEAALRSRNMVKGIGVLEGTPVGMLPGTAAPDAADIYGAGARSAILGRGEGEQANQQFVKDLFSRWMSNAPTDQKNNLSNIFATRSAAGVLPGELKMDQTLAGMPPDTLTQAMRIKLGTMLSAPESANLGLNYAQLRSHERLGMMSNAVDEAKIFLAKGAATKEEIPKLLEIQTQLMKDLSTQSKTGLAPWEIEQRKSALRAIQTQLNALGVKTLDIPEDSDPFQGGFLHQLFRKGF